ncbi:MAG: sugar nucleotide-binding protein [Patescibacteria group bacterium]
MKILMIGANSYVGARLYFDLKDKYDLIGTYYSIKNKLSDKFINLDITDKEAVEKTITTIKPEIVIHVASNTSSRWCNENPEAAKKINVDGTRNIVESANKIGVKILYISTTAIYNKDTKYATTKLEAEEVVKETKFGWFILRPSLIYGYSPHIPSGRSFDRILKNIDKGLKAEYDNIQKTQLTWTGHISEVIDEILKRNIWNKIVVVISLGMKSRFDIAKDILKYFNVEVFSQEGDKMATYEGNTDELEKLDLPTYSYEEIIKKIVSEIKNRGKYIL